MHENIPLINCIHSYALFVGAISRLPPPLTLPPDDPFQAHGMIDVWQWRAVGNCHGKNNQPKRVWQLGMISQQSELQL